MRNFKYRASHGLTLTKSYAKDEGVLTFVDSDERRVSITLDEYKIGALAEEIRKYVVKLESETTERLSRLRNNLGYAESKATITYSKPTT